MDRQDFSRRRCYNHPQREAAARCPGCGRYFCRECVTEHEDKVLCASCIREASGKQGHRRALISPLFRVAQAALGLLVTWLFFYYIGRILLAIPDSFHEGTVWEKAGQFLR